MTRDEAIRLIDDHKNKLIDPVEMLMWTWIRVIILQIPQVDWERYITQAAETLSR